MSAYMESAPSTPPLQSRSPPQSHASQSLSIALNNNNIQSMAIRDWIEKMLARAKDKPLLRLFLVGLKGQVEKKKAKPYGYYPRLISAVLSLCFAKWLTDHYKLEMNVRGYNWFIPEYVYKVREQSYIYWELARLANKLPTTFTYYKWGDNLMYEIDRQGNQTPYHSHAGIENPNTFDSFLHEYNFPASPETHTQIMLYLKNIKNPYNLQNYLRAKSINLGDWLRAAYYFVYRELGITNRWRYDEYVSKPSVFYSWQKIKWAHLLSKDREKLYASLDDLKLGNEQIRKFFVWFS